MTLHTIMYSSREVNQFTEDQKRELLEAARTFNASHGITGMLLYFDRVFFQVLEGDRAVLQDLLAKIKKDKRHQDFKVLLDEPTTERLFPEWSMAYRALDGRTVASDQQLEQMLGADMPDNGNSDRMSQRIRFLSLVGSAARSMAA